MKDTLAIVDGNYLMIRCVMSNPNLRSMLGEPTGGMYLFLKGLYRILKEGKDVIVVFDGGHNKKRLEIYPQYKVKEKDPRREAVQEVLKFSFDEIIPLLRTIGVNTVKMDGEEADDIIYLLANYYQTNWNIVLASDDYDYLQMINPDIKVYRPMKQDYITYRNFEDSIGYPLKYHVLYKSLIGDKSDNIPSACSGFGEKTALKTILMMAEQGLEPTSDNVIKIAQENSKSKVYQKLVDCKEIIDRNMSLIDISKVVDLSNTSELDRYLNFVKESLELTAPNQVEVMKAFSRFGFKTLTQWIVYTKSKEDEIKEVRN